MKTNRLFCKLTLALIMALLPLFARAQVVIGDINNDGKFNISDVTALISYLLTQDGTGLNTNMVDINRDGSVNISDVTYLINILLRNSSHADSITFTVNGVSFTMCRVEGGTFMMGRDSSTPNEENSCPNGPAHPVTVSTFYIGQTPVTKELWKAVAGNTCSDLYPGEQVPATYISFSQCETFATQLSVLAGSNFRVPTEAEWEFAARGGNLSHGYLYAGGDNYEDVAGIPGQAIFDVGLGAPNELGLYDMSGNCWELVRDFYYLYEYSDVPVVNPCYDSTAGSGGYNAFRIVRGGPAHSVYYRSSNTHLGSYGPADLIGVRLVMIPSDL